MLYSIILSLHNLNRWLVLLVGLWTIWQVMRGWLGHRGWQSHYTTLLQIFTRTIDLQFLLGLALYLLPGAFIQAALQNIPWAQIMQERLLRFFTLEHPLQMIIAVVLANITLSMAKRIPQEQRRLRWTAILLLLTMLLIVLAIPWPGFYYGRPWLRLPW
ncbi:MAG: hypothetical protein DYG89_38115 [Caldilinea sp. CFX5]|nr:hypothetical protein [Caldilinea sp. CFX5]